MCGFNEGDRRSMNRILTRGLASAALIALAACNRGGTASAPTGQVIAKVGGEEITQRELSAELNGFSSQDEATTKAAQQAALNAIVNRKLLAHAAEEAGVEKSADFQLMKHRADELMLAQVYEQQLASKLPKPSQQEVDQYIAQHPNTFAERKIFTLDQIKVPRSTDRKVLDRLKPLHSMDEVEQVLLSAGVDYAREPATLDARSTPPALTDQIVKVGSSEPFVIPSGNAITINQVTQTRTVPFTGAPATDLAQKALMSERANKTLKDRLAELKKAAGGVQYQAGYAPAQSSATTASKP
jgi:EpsD family peptidyl-prolyl cis-trans isomerase